MFPDTFEIDENYHIRIGGVAVQQLAEKYGTPVYVLDYATMVHRLQMFKDVLNTMVRPGRVYYAGKAFLNKAMAGFLAHEGVGLDVVSGGELYTALAGGFPARDIVFHGNVKSSEEIYMGLEAGVGFIVVDSLDELSNVDRIAGILGVEAPVLLRLTPGIEAHTHAFIQTGQFDSKFGFGMTAGIHEQALQEALLCRHVQLKGFHAHIGSQIFEEDPFVHNARRLMEFVQYAYETYQFWPEVLDIGGGFGVQYSLSDDPPLVSRILQRVDDIVRNMTVAGHQTPIVFIEPGRAIVAEAGVTLYRVNATKTVPGGRRYVAVDGGMGDNIRPALYQAQYVAQIDGRIPEAQSLVTIAGRYCESGDIIIRDIALPAPERGDLLVVYATGAYNYSMASNYNRVPRPAVVLVHRAQTMEWNRRESYDDLLRNDSEWHDPELL